MPDDTKTEESGLRRESERRLIFLVTLQVVASLLIALFVLGAFVWIGSKNPDQITTVIEALVDWGGVIMGFIFGSMFSQLAGVINAFRMK
jgi:hypothetical protein